MGLWKHRPFVDVDDVMNARSPPRQTPRAAQSEVLGGRVGKSRREFDVVWIAVKSLAVYKGLIPTQVYSQGYFRTYLDPWPVVVSKFFLFLPQSLGKGSNLTNIIFSDVLKPPTREYTVCRLKRFVILHLFGNHPDWLIWFASNGLKSLAMLSLLHWLSFSQQLFFSASSILQPSTKR